MTNVDYTKRWIALVILCFGYLMIVLDMTVVNVALPSIREDLGFTETSLVWVVNAYMITFSGFLLLGGRLGDLYGRRRIFLTGLALFTLASLVCGLADSQEMLIVARTIQGLGGAIVSAAALSIIITLFTEEKERAKAMGLFGFVAAGGGAIGVLVGGLLTGTFDWHWIFLVNIPVGILVFLACLYLLPKSSKGEGPQHLDVWGAITVTLSLMLAVYAIVNSTIASTGQTLGVLAVAVLLFLLFIYIETKTRGPLVPLSIFKQHNVSTASIIGIFWSASMFSWFFLSALYLQLVLGYTPMQVGLSFLPANIIMAIFSLGLSAKIVLKYGTKKPLALGMSLVAVGLLLFAFAPIEGNFVLHVLPSMILLGLGAGLAFNPVLLSAMSEVKPEESGLASGVLNTAFMMGGALGLAILASLAAYRTETLLGEDVDQLAALLGGYHTAFLIGAICAALAAILAHVRLREGISEPHQAIH